MDRTRLGEAGLVGWREKVAEGVAGPLSNRSPLSTEDARALIGAAFFALSAYYVASTAARMAREARS